MVLCTICFTALNSVTFGQGRNKVNGYFINNNGDTTKALFIVPIFGFVPDMVKIQRKIKYLDNYNNKLILTPEQAKEIYFIGFKMISLKNEEGVLSKFKPSIKYFVHLSIDGKIKLYKFYKRDIQSAGFVTQVSFKNNFIFQRQDGKLNSPPTRKKLSEYFSDCPELSEKIKNKENRESDYNTTETEFMVIDYNKLCGK